MEFIPCYNNDALVKSPRSVILRSGATKNLNDIKFFAIAQNDKRVFFRLFTSLSFIETDKYPFDDMGEY